MEQYRCPRCQAEFSTADQLDRHMRQHAWPAEHHPERAPGEFRSADESGGRQGKRSPADFHCPRCGAEFATREELDRHGRAQHFVE